ncbi:MAG TPA: hypothetical protein VIW67_15195 [Terriglobales bacterium]|jgi:hypothetical protein
MAVHQNPSPPKDENLKPFSIKLAPEEIRDLQFLASSEVRTVSNLIRVLVINHLESQKDRLEEIKKKMFVADESAPDPNPSLRDKKKSKGTGAD